MKHSIGRRLFARNKSSGHVDSGQKQSIASSSHLESASLIPLATDEPQAVPQSPLPDVIDEPVQNLSHSTTIISPQFQGPRIEKPDLWLLALERSELNNEQSLVLLSPPTGGETEPWSPVQFVQEVKDVTRDRYVEGEKSGWFAKARGCKAVIKQRAGTVLMAVLELKDFVSEGLKYDVTGYGATAWSIITFGLRVRTGTGIDCS
ncbi:hypothetical protein J4E93_002097 [Alternaria ventricosa]|uniref:uncharacterized protein n=1 Tax=Alternaria ventricosa TaxID=1187951 RepID=UPI0020C38FEF|nr:uncharacterized protein J4E93_002097 [Alternaria ventricosa]KAI4651901.1 hypothetical protein J4E93_002097 [Alternaria ventricosa]